ncbi:MAG: hypothetical protein PVG51_15635 [Desulfosarcina sp.]
MIRRLFYFFLVVGPLVLMGCSLGPSMMRANRMTYNDALQFTERQELLLNIVRLRYNEGPEFLATSSISTQFTIDLGASAGGTIGDEQLQRTELLNIGGAVGYSERPTITFTPRNEKEFSQQLISPIELEIIHLLVNYGWDIDRVLRLTAEGINGIRNSTVREDPSDNYDLQLRQFAELVRQFERLQQLGMLEISLEKEETDVSGPISAEKIHSSDILEAKKNNHQLVYHAPSKTYQLKQIHRLPVLRFSRDAIEQPEFQRIAERLRLASNTQVYRLINAPGSQIKASETTHAFKDLLFSTRSVLGTMAYLSQGVSVPNAHIEGGLVAHNQRHEASNAIISDLFAVKAQEEKPVNAGMAIPYKGFWFYIEDNDISSRRTMGVLNSLVRLKIEATGTQNTPVLTLPVGR